MISKVQTLNFTPSNLRMKMNLQLFNYLQDTRNRICLKFGQITEDNILPNIETIIVELPGIRSYWSF